MEGCAAGASREASMAVAYGTQRKTGDPLKGALQVSIRTVSSRFYEHDFYFDQQREIIMM